MKESNRYLISCVKALYSTVQGDFHQPAHPRGEGAARKRIKILISTAETPKSAGLRSFRGGVKKKKFYRPRLPVFFVSKFPPRVRGGMRMNKESGRGLFPIYCNAYSYLDPS